MPKNQVLRFLRFYPLIWVFQASSRTPKGRIFRDLSIGIENSSFHGMWLGIEPFFCFSVYFKWTPCKTEGILPWVRCTGISGQNVNVSLEPSQRLRESRKIRSQTRPTTARPKRGTRQNSKKGKLQYHAVPWYNTDTQGIPDHVLRMVGQQICPVDFNGFRWIPVDSFRWVPFDSFRRQIPMDSGI